MLHCRSGAFYVGQTDDLERRIAQHHSGLFTGFTKDRLPVALVWSEEFGTRQEAFETERKLKGWSRAKKMALIRGDWASVRALAKGRHSSPVQAELVEASSFFDPSAQRKDGPSTSSGQTGLGR